MPTVTVNYLAVLVAAVFTMAVGFAWYSMPLFGKSWMKMSGVKAEDLEKNKKQMGPKYGLMALAAFVMAYVLTHIISYAQADTLVEGLQGGFWVWLGFVATVGLNSFIFENKPFNLYLINVGYYLVSLAGMGAILAVLG